MSSFASFVSSLKDKSTLAMSTLSADLKEFTSIVQEDVAEVAKNVRKTVHEQSEAMRIRVEEQKEDINDATRQDTGDLFSFRHLSLESMSSKLLHTADELLETIAGSEVPPADPDDAQKVVQAQQYRLIALQEDSETYTEPPMDMATFIKWQQTMSSEEFSQQQTQVSAQYPLIQSKYKELVSTEIVSHDTFWMHYLYKVQLLAAQEQREVEVFDLQIDEEEEISWDLESPLREDNENVFQPLETDTTCIETASEGGESWTNVDPPGTQPLSSSSTSSFVPVYTLQEGVYVANTVAKDDECDWGEEVADTTSTSSILEKDSTSSATVDTSAQGGDWGDWD